MLDDDPYPYFDYLTQNQIGQLVGVSAQQVGRWLTSLGLREGKAASADALASGLAKEVSGDGVTFFAWHKQRVVERLREEGLVAASKAGASTSEVATAVEDKGGEGLRRKASGMVGPFTSRTNGGDGFEILNGDGTIVVWARGGESAHVLVRLLNLACKCGHLK